MLKLIRQKDIAARNGRLKKQLYAALPVSLFAVDGEIFVHHAIGVLLIGKLILPQDHHVQIEYTVGVWAACGLMPLCGFNSECGGNHD